MDHEIDNASKDSPQAINEDPNVLETLQNLWKNDLRELKKASGLPKLNIEFHPEGQRLYDASTTANNIFIGRGLLGCSEQARRYIISHEIGHKLKRHDLLFWGILSAAFLPAIIAGPALYFMQSEFRILAAVWLIFLLVPYILIKEKTLLLEYQADIAAKNLLDRAFSNSGENIMINGMDNLAKHRARYEPQQAEPEKLRYARKKQKLTLASARKRSQK